MAGLPCEVSRASGRELYKPTREGGLLGGGGAGERFAGSVPLRAKKFPSGQGGAEVYEGDAYWPRKCFVFSRGPDGDTGAVQGARVAPVARVAHGIAGGLPPRSAEPGGAPIMPGEGERTRRKSRVGRRLADEILFVSNKTIGARTGPAIHPRPKKVRASPAVTRSFPISSSMPCTGENGIRRGIAKGLPSRCRISASLKDNTLNQRSARL